MSGRLWSLALCVSVLMHGAGLAAIALATKTEPVADQPVPKSRFSIEAANAPRSRAAPKESQADPVSETKTTPTTAQAGTITRTRAQQAQPVSDRLDATAPDTPVLVSSTAALRVSQSTAPATALDASIATSEIVAAQIDAPTTTLAALNAPAALPVSSAPQELLPAATLPVAPQTAAAFDATVAPPTPPSAPKAHTLTLPATAGKAVLAWSGEQDAPVSPASLAAIAAFTRQGDLAAASAQIRDGIGGILAAVPCARLQTMFIPETGQLELRGHIPQEGLRAPVLEALRAQVGDSIPVSDQLLILPRPQCGALAGIAAIGLPQSTEQLTNPAVIGSDGFARTFAYADGERLSLDLTAPDYDSYIYVDYFAADGSVIHLQPNDVVPLEFATAKAALSVGRARADGSPSLELTVSAPFGQEIAAAFAASHPLYEGTRPLQEPAGAYLQFLKERVTETRAKNADFKGEWVYFFITTSAD
ncbi:MAG: DUF4384 domain-containing protein [Sulfitobacter sp.]